MELEKNNNRTISKNELDNALVVMANTLARKQTKWNARENKLFLTALSQIKQRDNENWVRLSKADVVAKLDIDPRDTNKLREMFLSVMHKSMLKFDGPTEEEWDDGFMIIQIRTTKKDVFVRFNSTYLPLLDQLESYFTMFKLDNVVGFKSKYAIVLFQDLKSRYDNSAIINHWRYSLDELKYLFGIKEGEYVRNTGRKTGSFDTANFKKYTIDVAVEEINKDPQRSRMHIETVDTVKFRGRVVGYDIAFCLVDENGYRYDAEEDTDQLKLF